MLKLCCFLFLLFDILSGVRFNVIVPNVSMVVLFAAVSFLSLLVRDVYQSCCILFHSRCHRLRGLMLLQSPVENQFPILVFAL